MQVKRRFPSIRLPKLPPKKLMGNASEEFLEKRRAELETYLGELLSVPIIRASEEVSRTLELSSTIDVSPVATLSIPATAPAPAPSSDGPVSAPASSSSERRCVRCVRCVRCAVCVCVCVCVRACVPACVFSVCVSLICVCAPAQHAHLVVRYLVQAGGGTLQL